MLSRRIRIYYHLFNGPSWQPVWAMHRPRLQTLIEHDAVDRLVVCAFGFDAKPELGLQVRHGVDLRLSRRLPTLVNEFDTLAELRRDACGPDPAFAHVAYLHSKGASAPRLTLQASSWTDWLSDAHAGLVTRFDGLARAGFGAAGANLAWGVFDHFEPPRLHYSGNFWCATREQVRAAPSINPDQRQSSIRHNAEWWLSAGSKLPHFNLFCSGLDHYAPEGVEIDRLRLAARLSALDGALDVVGRAMAQQDFVCRQLRSAIGAAPWRRCLAIMSLAALPYGRWPRLFLAHDRAMRLLGSRKSTYFYCPET